MPRKINIRLILELVATGASQRSISQTRSISRNSISQVCRIAEEKGITSDSIKDMDDNELYRLFFPNKISPKDMFVNPDYPTIHQELKRVGVTLKLLYQEYCVAAEREGGNAMGYTKFCNGYREYVRRNQLTNHLYHKPGFRCEVDWAGSTMSYTDQATQEKIRVYLFVAALPYSQYAYVEPRHDRKQMSWLSCHVNLYNYFGGVPTVTICDNLKTGVISHPREGEIVLNREYEGLGHYYRTSIMPTGVAKPKQKASVESTVGKVTTAIIARFRNTEFRSFCELKDAVAEALEEFNAAPFQKREGSRLQSFEEERLHLQPLPATPYEICEWRYKVLVPANCHITYKRNFYSCPYQHRGTYVSLKVTDKTLSIYKDNSLLSTHVLISPNEVNRYSTHKADLPDEFNNAGVDETKIRQKANAIGKSTLEVVDRLLKHYPMKEQGYNPSLAVLRLVRWYDNADIERACEFALAHMALPRFNNIKPILESMKRKRNRKADSQDDIFNDKSGHLRGVEYYRSLK